MIVRERVVVGGVGLEVEWIEPSGAARSPVVVFLHEGLGSISAWRDFPARVAAAAGLRAMVYSRAGYGGSDTTSLPRPLDYMQREAIDVLPKLLDELGIGDAFLFGHSDGASIALVYASTDHGRTRARGLVLEAPHVFCEEKAVRAIAITRDELLHRRLRDRLARHHGPNTDVAFWGWNDAWLDPGFRAWSIEGFLPRVTCPVLVIQSDDDPYGTLLQVDAIESGCTGPVTRHILEQCGHAPHRDHADEVLALTVAFTRARAGQG
ncbi:MAG: alpha/beta hydrolase [Deltaproteobacteria bacterium]|nr:alpha/beta hydrolase [Deltaproteobacteria bacterium]